MAISLSPEVERQVQDRISQGAYGSAEEVLLAAMNALKVLEDLALDEDTLDAIDEAEDQIERGEVVDWSELRKGLIAH